MRIYQIHERYGEWEDEYDHIIASYINKEKAKHLLIQLNDKNSDIWKCKDCPLFNRCDDCWNESCKNCDVGVNEVARYCSRYEPYDGDYKCINANFYNDEAYFYMEEIEVIK